jgi:hypothetical protein
VRSLKEWKRVFLLDPRFSPTRKAARRIALESFRLDKGWCLQQWFVADEPDLYFDNRSAIDDFVRTLTFIPDTSISGATKATAHSVAACSLKQLREVVTQLRFPAGDSRRFTALGLLLASAAEELPDSPDACTVVSIAAGMHPKRRERAVGWTSEDESVGRVVLHQGRNPGEGEPRYTGDGKARDADRLTLQIHRLDLRNGANGPLIADAKDLPFVGIYVPSPLHTGILHEL